MAIFRKLHTSFWTDTFVEELDRDQKLFYIYLLTNDKTKQCGIYEISKKQISFDLGYSMDTVSIHLNYFIKKGKIRYNDATKELAIKNWLKYNGSTSPKVKSCINTELKAVKDRVLIEYINSIDTLSQEEQEEEQEEEYSENKFSVPEKSDQTNTNTPNTETLKTKTKKTKTVPAAGVQKIVHPSYGFIKERFLDYYQLVKETPYYFEAKDGDKVNRIITKLKTLVKAKNPKITKEQEPDAINKSFNYIIRNMNDTFVIENLTLSMIDSKFNEIVAKIKNPKPDTKESTSIEFRV